ncbi:MAG: abortive infection system antitoxin AbiGi family protein [Chitinophagaceae bacterium]
MKVSSDSLFHFTDSLLNILSILEIKFKLSYCREKYTLNGTSDENIFPMITFCDLPLSLTKDHISKYGNYAIGMKKSWGIKNKLNPVIYIEENSVIASDLDKSLSNLTELFEQFGKLSDSKSPKMKELFFEMFPNLSETTDVNLNIFRYLKNYQGTLHRKNKTIKNYRFYDEREWRFVPEMKDKRIKTHLTEQQYQTFRKKSKKKPLIDSITLDFSASDIDYLIVKSAKDIPRLIKKIQSINNLAKNGDQLLELTTKIFTVEQLNKDFQ